MSSPTSWISTIASQATKVLSLYTYRRLVLGIRAGLAAGLGVGRGRPILLGGLLKKGFLVGWI